MGKNRNNYYLPRFFALLANIVIFYFFSGAFAAVMDRFLPAVRDDVLVAVELLAYALILSFTILSSGQSFGMRLFKIKFAPYGDESMDFFSIYVAELLVIYAGTAFFSYWVPEDLLSSYEFYLTTKYSVYIILIVSFVTLFSYGKLPQDLIRSTKIIRLEGSYSFVAVFVLLLFLAVNVFMILVLSFNHHSKPIDYDELKVNFSKEANYYKQIYYKELKEILNNDTNNKEHQIKKEIALLCTHKNLKDFRYSDGVLKEYLNSNTKAYLSSQELQKLKNYKFKYIEGRYDIDTKECYKKIANIDLMYKKFIIKKEDKALRQNNYKLWKKRQKLWADIKSKKYFSEYEYRNMNINFYNKDGFTPLTLIAKNANFKHYYSFGLSDVNVSIEDIYNKSATDYINEGNYTREQKIEAKEALKYLESKQVNKKAYIETMELDGAIYSLIYGECKGKKLPKNSYCIDKKTWIKLFGKGRFTNANYDKTRELVYKKIDDKIEAKLVDKYIQHTLFNKTIYSGYSDYLLAKNRLIKYGFWNKKYLYDYFRYIIPSHTYKFSKISDKDYENILKDLFKMAKAYKINLFESDTIHFIALTNCVNKKYHKLFLSNGASFKRRFGKAILKEQLQESCKQLERSKLVKDIKSKKLFSRYKYMHNRYIRNNINFYTKKGFTPLTLIAKQGSYFQYYRLQNTNANINKKDKFNKTPLMYIEESNLTKRKKIEAKKALKYLEISNTIKAINFTETLEVNGTIYALIHIVQPRRCIDYKIPKNSFCIDGEEFTKYIAGSRVYNYKRREKKIYKNIKNRTKAKLVAKYMYHGLMNRYAEYIDFKSFKKITEAMIKKDILDSYYLFHALERVLVEANHPLNKKKKRDYKKILNLLFKLAKQRGINLFDDKFNNYLALSGCYNLEFKKLYLQNGADIADIYRDKDLKYWIDKYCKNSSKRKKLLKILNL